ncbi:MAG: shikimate dehydrogenase [Spirochaetia bacterium]|nr:shikimate dehydrogenase [Spirochaetia bacterium]
MIKINTQTKIYGIIGYPLGHTFSPVIHNTAFQAANINAVYLAFPIKNLINLKAAMKKLNIHGVSVTIPHKIKVMRLVDKIDSLAVQIGSVNTVLWNKAGLLEGYNTDGLGAVEAIKEKMEIKGKNVLIIGSGGSARAIGISLLKEAPAKIGILSRNNKSAVQLIKNLRLIKKSPKLEFYFFNNDKTQNFKSKDLKRWSTTVLSNSSQLKEFDLIINTTPIGMKGYTFENQTPLNSEYLFSHQTVFDIVYNPKETPLIKLCKKKKINIIYGHKMLLYQAAHQFKLFTGQTAPLKEMESALQKELLIK